MSKNILFITSDQQHWNTLGCINPEVKTPHLDKLASEGTRFSRAYCPNPTCTPTRASLITGMYPSQHGAWTLGTKLLESVPRMTDLLSAHGHRTALIGKAHFQPLKSTEEFPSLEAYPTLQDLDFWRSYEGPFYGFEDFALARNHVDEAHVGQHYAIWLEGKGLTNWRDYFKPPTGTRAHKDRTWEIPEEFHYNNWIAEESIARLERYAEKGEVFFLWSSFFDPHPAYTVPEPWASMYDPAELTVPQMAPGEHDDSPPQIRMTQAVKPDFSGWNETNMGNHGFHGHRHSKEDLARDIATYYGMVSCMDAAIGRILNRLEELGLAEETLVVFTSDHGHFYGHHGLVAKGCAIYDDAVRVPMLARLPGVIPAGQESVSLQTLVDLPATFLKTAGLDVPRWMSARDQMEDWLGLEGSGRDHVIVEHHHEPTTIYMKAYIEEHWKMVVYMNQPYGELYDLEADPGEVKNLWDLPEFAAVKSELLLKFVHADMAKEPMPCPRLWGA